MTILVIIIIIIIITSIMLAVNMRMDTRTLAVPILIKIFNDKK